MKCPAGCQSRGSQSIDPGTAHPGASHLAHICLSSIGNDTWHRRQRTVPLWPPPSLHIAYSANTTTTTQVGSYMILFVCRIKHFYPEELALQIMWSLLEANCECLDSEVEEWPPSRNTAQRIPARPTRPALSFCTQSRSLKKAASKHTKSIIFIPDPCHRQSSVFKLRLSLKTQFLSCKYIQRLKKDYWLTNRKTE